MRQIRTVGALLARGYGRNWHDVVVAWTGQGAAREGYVIEDRPEGRTLVVTGDWSDRAARVLASGQADGLVLNYARGSEPELTACGS